MENTTQITVADLGTLHAIVDLAAQRGAFRGAELAQVGAVFDKLTTFLEAVAEQAQAAEGNTDLNESAGAPADSTQGE
jgi:hypothetical protein